MKTRLIVMKFLNVLWVFVTIAGCKKTVTTFESNSTDYELLQNIINSAKDGDDIYLERKTYVLNHTLILTKSLHFYGNGTVITRENQVIYILKQKATSGSSYVILENTDGLIAGDEMIIALDSSVNGATVNRLITSIHQDTVKFDNTLNETWGSESVFPKGTKMFKSISLFKIPGYGYYRYYEISPSFKDIVFDGNRDNNKGSYYWGINTALLLLTSHTGVSTVDHCVIRNSPNESVVGHNMNLKNSLLYDLNGSGYHSSEDRINSLESDIHSEITGNTFRNTNEILNSVTGHSEGAITHSNSGGYYTATNNVFQNVGESVLGDLYHSVSPNDYGTNDIIFTGNFIDGAGRMIHGITAEGEEVKNVIIKDNSIKNMPYHDYSVELFYNPGIILEQE